MSSDGSITRLVNQFQVGNRVVAQQLWERYFHRLVGLARQKLGGLPRGAPTKRTWRCRPSPASAAPPSGAAFLA